MALDAGWILPLGAGSLAGAVGVGVAYPLDTLKTKQQVMQDGDVSACETAKRVLKQEGVSGFYPGVQSTMAGQAVIKAVAFASFSYAEQAGCGLLLSAALSGAINSFVVTPIERLKVVMQATEPEQAQDAVGNVMGQSTWGTLVSLIDSDGAGGVLFRGLGLTVVRQVPCYAIYFWTSTVASQALADAGCNVGLSSLVGGALAGGACWVPIYPVDVIKTNIQVRGTGTAVDAAVDLWQAGGIGAFWEGIGPKLARAMVNAAVTFYVYDQTVAMFAPSSTLVEAATPTS